jgi:23S rRNA pseudouridine2605 synthase
MGKRSESSSPGRSDSDKTYKKDASRSSGAPERKPFKKFGSGKEEGRPARSPTDGDDRKPSKFDRPKRSFDKKAGDANSDGAKRTFKKADGDRPSYGAKKSYDKKPYSGRIGPVSSEGKNSWDNKPEKERKDRSVFEDKKPWAKRASEQAAERPTTKSSKFPERREGAGNDGAGKPYKEGADRPIKKFVDRREGTGERKPYGKRGDDKPFNKREEAPERKKRSLDKEEIKKTFRNPNKKLAEEEGEEAPAEVKPRRRKEEDKPIENPMTLNKYISHSGECSRRDAAQFVKEGKVRVNGELVVDPGYRIVPGDQVTLLGKKLTPQTNLVYVLLNKPKGFITTTEDPEERKTVMDLVANAGSERLYPIGRLDRNTTGVLLLTNDGSLAHKLSHPSYNIKKVYQVTLDKNLSRPDYEKISKGVTLEDGLAQVDEIAYLENRNEIGLEIHSGKNRIVRRIFESLGYVVEKLDRVMYAGLTKKNVARGKWRFLTEREVVLLKHFKS